MSRTFIYDRVVKVQGAGGAVNNLIWTDTQLGNRYQRFEIPLLGADTDIVTDITIDVSVLQAITMRFTVDDPADVAELASFKTNTTGGVDSFSVSTDKPYIWTDAMNGILLPFSTDVTQMYLNGPGAGKDGTVIIEIVEEIA